jgi:hypothetical protein
MNSDQDYTFRPRLESLEDRFLLSTTAFRSFVPASFHPVAFTAFRPVFAGGTHTPAQVPTILHPAVTAAYNVSLVPHHISLGLFDKPSPVSVNGLDTGIGTPGLRTPSVLASDAGFSIPGLPSFAPAQPVTPPPLQSTGFTMSPQGIISGNLF